MSNSQINLIQKKEDPGLRNKKKIALFRTISFILLGITGLFALVLIFLYSQIKIASIEESQKAIIQEITPLREKSAKLMTINNRATGIKEIMDKRIDFYYTLNEIMQQIPSSITVSTINISKDDVQMRFSSYSLYDCKSFIERMTSLAVNKKIIKDLVINGFSYSPRQGLYSFSLSSNLL